MFLSKDKPRTGITGASAKRKAAVKPPQLTTSICATKSSVYNPMYVCMDGWMDGWMGGWMDGWMDVYVRTYVRMYLFIYTHLVLSQDPRGDQQTEVVILT